jgi:hypothetical protein
VIVQSKLHGVFGASTTSSAVAATLGRRIDIGVAASYREVHAGDAVWT